MLLQDLNDESILPSQMPFELDARHGLLFDKRRCAVAQNHLDLPVVLEAALDELFRQRIADGALDDATHRSGTVQRFVPFLDEPLLDLVVDIDADALVDQAEFNSRNRISRMWIK